MGVPQPVPLSPPTALLLSGETAVGFNVVKELVKVAQLGRFKRLLWYFFRRRVVREGGNVCPPPASITKSTTPVRDGLTTCAGGVP